MKLLSGIFYTNNLVLIRDFYINNLGLEIDTEDSKFIQFKIGESFLGIKVKEDAREIPGHQTIIISVNDVDGWYKRLNDNGINIYKELSDEGWGKNFAILDLDGNKVEFIKS